MQRPYTGICGNVIKPFSGSATTMTTSSTRAYSFFPVTVQTYQRISNQQVSSIIESKEAFIYFKSIIMLPPISICEVFNYLKWLSTPGSVIKSRNSNCYDIKGNFQCIPSKKQKEEEEKKAMRFISRVKEVPSSESQLAHDVIKQCCIDVKTTSKR